MKLKDLLSKEHIADGLRSLTKLRPKIDHSSLLTISALTLILFIAFAIRLFPMRWEIQTGSMYLSEFDPYHQYRFTEYILKNGFISWAYPTQWVDPYRWYPAGYPMFKSYPALPMTGAFFYVIVSALGINIRLMDFCALFPPIMGTLACIIIYFLGKNIGGKPVGLFAALFLALSPSYIQRTSVGFYDDETIGIIALLLFFFLFLKAIEEERPASSTVKYSLASAATLGYFCSGWGAAYYPIGIIVLFVFMSILLKRYTRRLLLSYGLTFGLGLFIATNLPRHSTTFLTNSAILPVAGVFVLLCLCEVFRALASPKWRVISVIVFLAMLIGGFSVFWQLGYMQGIAGKFISVINPFVRAASPLIESVAEHRISAWGSIYYEFGIVIIFFVASLFFILRNLNAKNLFLLIFGLTSLYFACSMVRLLVLMAPAFGLLAAVGIVGILKPFNTLLKEPPKISAKKKYGSEYVGKEFSGAAVFLIFLVLMTSLAFPMPKVYRQAYSPITITAGSLPIVPNEPVQEWLNMLDWTKNNLEATTVVCSWWDYGYWLTVLGNVTTLADNATINTTQIENIGFTFIANETQALKMLKLYDAEYILVFTTSDVNGRWVGYGDEGKWMWMACISGKARERFIEKHFIDAELMWNENFEDVRRTFGNYTLGMNWADNNHNGQVDDGELIPTRGQNTTIYKLMSYAVNRWLEVNKGGSKPQESEYFKEAFIAGLNLSPSDANKYGGIVPLICLYEIVYPNE